MFENIMKFFKKLNKKDEKVTSNSKDAAKERLHLVLMQDRANVSADFLELMKQEIIEVIKKYIEVDEGAIDVRLTNKENEDGSNGAPALYANIPIINIKNEARKVDSEELKTEKVEDKEEKEAEPNTNKDSNLDNEAKKVDTNQTESSKESEIENIEAIIDESSKDEENATETKIAEQ